MSELPSSWKLCRYDGVAKVVSGKNQKAVESTNGKYPIFGSGGSFGYAQEYLCEAGTTIVGRKGTINSPIFVNERFWNVDTAFGLYPLSIEHLIPRLLFYFCLSFDFKKLDKSTTIPSLAKRDIEAINFPLPPLNEQKRIVAKIEELFSELDAGEASLRQAKQQLGVYRQSLLKQAFEGKLTQTWRQQNPDKRESPDLLLARISETTPSTLEPHECDDWKTIQFGELTEYITSGSRGWAAYYSDSGSTFIRAQNLNKDHLDLSDIAYVTLPEKVEGKRTLTQVGDILVTITGANVTKTGYIDRDIGEAYVSQHVALCRVLDSRLTKFLYLYLISPAGGRKDLEKAAYGAGKPGLNLTNLRELRVPLCSLAEQREIVRLLDAQFEVIEQNEGEIDAALRRSEALRQSILKKAFTGQLVPPACRRAGKTQLELPESKTGKWWVYVLECEDGSFYKGFTEDLPKRWQRHLKGTASQWTKRNRPLHVYYYEEHTSEEASISREKFLKSGSGREWFKREVVEKPDTEFEPASQLLARLSADKAGIQVQRQTDAPTKKAKKRATKKTARKRPHKPNTPTQSELPL